MKNRLSTPAIIILSAILMISISCGNTSNNASNPSAATAPAKPSFSKFISEKQFNDLFPLRDKFYTYAAFIKAVDDLGNIKVKVTKRATSVYQLIRTDKRTGKAAIVRQDVDWNENWAKQKPDSAYTIDYGAFCSEKDVLTNKKELAAFFAHMAHETRHGQNGVYNDGLMYTHEVNTSLPYIAESDEYPPVAGKKYYGRGPLQLSYNGNYGYASDCIFGDHKILLNNPDLVQNDPVVAFKAAIYFWMTPQTRKPSAHDVMIGKWQPNAADHVAGRQPGFGMTINIINGAVECNQGDNMPSMTDRIAYYQHFLKMLNVKDDNCACSCGKMQAYQ
ncbi:chitinase class I [Mucilaginibacter yixingensis]|uniref:Chitinase class I n=1 Tax=Mucilaginibacter yixingensis TaxID=1295612 RepID=A0A2T5J787_9SPHI|nr:chitinase [Mucilaginibacter yixingensis]PTQ95010.1 chitinase class I [Mucilaginibacter yixingensis]